MNGVMSRSLGRAAATAALAALLAIAWLAGLYAWHPGLNLEFDVDPPKLVSGVYPAERDPQSGLTFAWTGAEMSLRLPGLDRRVDWVMDVRVRGAHPVASANPEVSYLADGVVLLTRRSGLDFEDVRVTIPARPARLRGVTIGVRSASTFVPGPSDPRPLGVVIDRLTLTASGAVLPPRLALYGAAISSAAMGSAIALLGVTPGAAICSAILLSAADAAIISRGFGPFTDFPAVAARLAIGIGLAVALGTAWVQRLRHRPPLRNTARFVAAFTAGALFLKLLVLLHPDMPIGDAMFQAHRFQGVLGGNLFFTSIAPGGYSFPYAPGLYVLASAFSRLVPRGPSDMALLRIIVCSADALAAVLLYRMIVQAWNDRTAGAVAVALYHLTPLDFAVETVGNLTNAFSQSVAVAALALIAAGSLRLERAGMVAALSLVIAAAYLSHTSTLAILFVATVAIAALYRRRGGPALRSPAAAVLIATSVAAALSVALYYAHFSGTYRAEFSRLSRETAAAAADAGGRTIGDRAVAVPYYLRTYFGLPLLGLAAIGVSKLWMRGAADRLTLAVTGWGIACALFLVVGVLTPIDMRYYLAAIPALAIVAGFGASRAWMDGMAWRAAAAALLAWAAATGVHNWWTAIR